MRITAEKRAYWESHLAAWKRSGLTQRAYCQRESIAYGSFKNWRSQLLGNPKSLSFVEATPLETEQPSPHALVLQISLANGSRIGVSGQASSEVIQQALNLAGGLL